MVYDVLIPSQKKAFADAISESGIPSGEFQVTEMDGDWIGLIDDTTPAFRHTPTGFSFAYGFRPEMSDQTGYGYDPGGYGCDFSPGVQKPSETHNHLAWPRMLDLFRTWLRVIKREVNALKPGTYKEPEEVKPDERPGPLPAVPAAAPSSYAKKVFVIHGHDEANALKLARLLKDRYGLQPVIMRFQPGKGRTLIEKFEEEAADCAFAYALLTPDDEVGVGNGKYTQARPNVVFELGWFYGRLGRDHVVLLLKSGTHIHSDLNGISRIEFSASVEERILDIEEELRAAGMIS